MMPTRLRFALISMAFLLGGVAVASANTCFVDGNGDVLVGQGFTLPGKAVCTTFKGYFAGTTSVVYGDVCGTSDGSAIRGTLTVLLGQLQFSLNRSTLTGAIRSCSPTGCATAVSFSKVSCSSVQTDFH